MRPFTGIPPPPSPQDSNTIEHKVTIVSQFELVKELDGIFLNNMILTENTLFAVASFSELENQRLMSINLATEEVNWQVCHSREFTVGPERVYISDEPGSVTVYDRITGNETWQTNVDRKFPVVDALDIVEFGLLAETRNRTGTRFHLLDLETGSQKHSFQNKVEKQNFWIENNQVVYTPVGLDSVEAKGLVPWQTPIDPSSNNRTSFKLVSSDSTILAYRKRDHSIIQLTALDKIDGTILWQGDREIKSNIAVSGDIIYFVTDDLELLALDSRTGAVRGQANFLPRPEETPAPPGSPLVYTIVSVNNGKVMVYLGSSRQLFLFRFPSV